jgi:hypothetical protein
MCKPTIVRFMQEFGEEFSDAGYPNLSAMRAEDIICAVTIVAQFGDGLAQSMCDFLATIGPSEAREARLLTVAIVAAASEPVTVTLRP